MTCYFSSYDDITTHCFSSHEYIIMYYFRSHDGITTHYFSSRNYIFNLSITACLLDATFDSRRVPLDKTILTWTGRLQNLTCQCADKNRFYEKVLIWLKHRMIFYFLNVAASVVYLSNTSGFACPSCGDLFCLFVQTMSSWLTVCFRHKKNVWRQLGWAVISYLCHSNLS